VKCVIHAPSSIWVPYFRPWLSPLRPNHIMLGYSKQRG
jgi:hypothetical protein